MSFFSGFNSNPPLAHQQKHILIMSGSLKSNLTWWCGSSMPRALNQLTARNAVLSQFKYIISEKTETNQGNKKYFCFMTDQHINHLNLQVTHTHLHFQEPRVCHLASSWSLYVQAVCAVERKQKLFNLFHIHSTGQDVQLDGVAIIQDIIQDIISSALKLESSVWTDCFEQPHTALKPDSISISFFWLRKWSNWCWKQMRMLRSGGKETLFQRQAQTV